MSTYEHSPIFTSIQIADTSNESPYSNRSHCTNGNAEETHFFNDNQKKNAITLD